MTVATLSPTAITLPTLFIILAASAWVFIMLVRRETHHRRRVLFAEWAGTRGLRLMPRNTDANISTLQNFNPRIDALIRGGAVNIAQVRTNSPTATPAANAPRWNLLLRAIDQRWPPTALRPVTHPVSVIDLFSLSSYPSLASTERFMVFGSDSKAAGALAESSAAALLPPDVGLLFHENQMILDFTTRPFDEVEFGRMLDLAEQLARRAAIAI